MWNILEAMGPSTSTAIEQLSKRVVVVGQSRDALLLQGLGDLLLLTETEYPLSIKKA